MPAAKRYVNQPSLPEYKRLESAWRSEKAARQQTIGAMWRLYDGDFDPVLKPDKSKVDDNIYMNMIEPAIEKGAAALMGSDEVGEVEGVDFEIGGEDELVDQEDPEIEGTAVEEGSPEDWLEEFWKANKKGILLHDAAINGGVCGHVFIKLEPSGAGKYPRMINLNPACIGVFWAEDDADRVLWYRIEHETSRQDIVRLLNEDGSDAGGWRVYNYERKHIEGDGKIAAVVGSALYSAGLDTNPWKPATGVPAEIPWVYPWPPIVDWKNLPRPNRYYGKDDIGNNGRLNVAVNTIYSYVMRTLKIFTQPRTIATGVAADSVKETAVNNMWTIDAPEAKVFNLEMQSDMAAAHNSALSIQRMFWNTIREVDSSVIQDKLGDMSNFDLRVLYHDPLGKLTTKRLTYGDGLRRLCQYALELGGFGADMDVNVVWPDPLPSDPVAQRTALEKDVTIGGISQETYQERAGYDPERERLRKEQERADKVHDQSVINQGAAAGQMEALGRLMRMGQGQPPPPNNGGEPAYG